MIMRLQAEMLQRKEDRALELKEIRNKTRHVLKTFEDPEPREKRATAFQNRIVSVSIKRIGIAFPFNPHQTDVKAPSQPSFINSQKAFKGVPAFLFSIESLLFKTQREERGFAKVKNFAFQFVPS